jgi:hypothetical protein
MVVLGCLADYPVFLPGIILTALASAVSLKTILQHNNYERREMITIELGCQK